MTSFLILVGIALSQQHAFAGTTAQGTITKETPSKGAPVKARESLLQVRPTKPLRPVVIVPRQVRTLGPKPDPTRFVLTKAEPGKLIAAFQSSDANLILNPKRSPLIQLLAPAPIQFEPEITGPENWPPNATQTIIGYKNAPAGSPVRIQGKAAYSICDKRTGKCRRTMSPMSLELKP